MRLEKRIQEMKANSTGRQLWKNYENEGKNKQ
jgi:hypothetical protein